MMQNSSNVPVRQHHPMMMLPSQNQQQQQLPQPHLQAQSRRQEVPTGNLRLKQDFNGFKSAFTNVIKQMASDLTASAEATANGSADDAKRTNPAVTNNLLAEFDSAYAQLEYNLSMLHRTYVRQQQVFLQHQSAGLLQQNQNLANPDQAPVRVVVDKLTNLLKPPSNLMSAMATADPVQLQQQQQAAMASKLTAKDHLLNPGSNDSNSNSNIIAEPQEQTGATGVRITSKSASRATSSKSSSNASSRASPSDPMDFNSQQLADAMAPSALIPLHQEGARQPTVKRLIDLGYSDSESGDDRSSTGGRKLVASAMDVDVADNSRDGVMVDETSFPAPEQEHLESKPQVLTNEDSIGFSSMFQPSSGVSQIKVEGTLPYEGEEQPKANDDVDDLGISSIHATMMPVAQAEDDDVLSPAFEQQQNPVKLPEAQNFDN